MTTEKSAERRIDRLERRQKTTIVILLGLGGLAFVMGQSGQKRPSASATIRAREFILVDADGAVRGRLGVLDDDTTQLSIHGTNPNHSLELAVFQDGRTGITLNDAKGMERAWLGTFPDGGSQMGFHDERGRRRVIVGVSPNDKYRGGVSLLSPKGKEHGWFYINDEDRADLILSDGAGRRFFDSRKMKAP